MKDSLTHFCQISQNVSILGVSGRKGVPVMPCDLGYPPLSRPTRVSAIDVIYRSTIFLEPFSFMDLGSEE